MDYHDTYAYDTYIYIVSFVTCPVFKCYAANPMMNTLSKSILCVGISYKQKNVNWSNHTIIHILGL